MRLTASSFGVPQFVYNDVLNNRLKKRFLTPFEMTGALRKRRRVKCCDCEAVATLHPPSFLNNWTVIPNGTKWNEESLLITHFYFLNAFSKKLTPHF